MKKVLGIICAAAVVGLCVTAVLRSGSRDRGEA